MQGHKASRDADERRAIGVTPVQMPAVGDVAELVAEEAVAVVGGQVQEQFEESERGGYLKGAPRGARGL